MSKKYRADGTLRPTWKRVRDERRKANLIFNRCTIPQTRIWNNVQLQERLEQDYKEVSLRLEKMAGSRRWKKLRDRKGLVKAIGMPWNHPDAPKREEAP